MAKSYKVIECSSCGTPKNEEKNGLWDLLTDNESLKISKHIIGDNFDFEEIACSASCVIRLVNRWITTGSLTAIDIADADQPLEGPHGPTAKPWPE